MNFIQRNYKNILIGILFILFIIACLIIFYLLQNKNIKTSREVTGKVIIADKSYLIIETEKEDYLISNIKGTYEIGDTVKFSYFENKINNDTIPKQITINDEELIAKNKEELKDNKNHNNEINNNDTHNSNNEQNPENTNQNNTSTNTSSNKNTTNNSSTSNNSNNISQNNNTNNASNSNSNNYTNTSADVAVMNYMNELQTEMDKPSLGESVKKGFITVIDFLFYNGQIKGYTFNELSSSVKLKVLSMVLYFDSKIEKYFPGYKESISSTTKKVYNNVKNMIVSTYLNITTSICQNNSDICEQAKKDFASLKNNFGLTFDLIKDLASDGISNLKSWYEIWSGK